MLGTPHCPRSLARPRLGAQNHSKNNHQANSKYRLSTPECPQSNIVCFVNDSSRLALGVTLKSAINSWVAKKTGYHLSRSVTPTTDSSFSDRERRILQQCDGRTMTPPNSIVNLIAATEYVSRNRIDGAFVECGVWRGGSAMAFALTIMEEKTTFRDMFLYDTFEGFTDTIDDDFRIKDGKRAKNIFLRDKNYICQADLDDVKTGLSTTNYPLESIRFVRGDVVKTIPANLPKSISILRLDTDYYESTIWELRHLFPLLSKGGVLIVDDYDYWNGSRKACNEYFEEIGMSNLLIRLESGRMLVKQ